MKVLGDPSHGDHIRREEMLVRIERLTELPLLVLSFVMVPLLLGPLLWDLSPETETTYVALDAFVWALFAIDLIAKIAIAPQKLAYMRAHWLEVVIVAVPFARPLRLLRLFVFGSRAFRGARRLTNVDFLLVYAIGLIVVAATAVTSFEVGHNSTINSFQDAMWWATVTVTTVGYGDMVPITVPGRAVAFVLMIGGIGLFGGLTANLASVLVKAEDPSKATLEHLVAEIQGLRREVAELRGALR
ncbi:MAG: ion channel [Chloroflexi bacterium]|nr:ion channel [Chloroflexota bacterium]